MCRHQFLQSSVHTTSSSPRLALIRLSLREEYCSKYLYPRRRCKWWLGLVMSLFHAAAIMWAFNASIEILFFICCEQRSFLSCNKDGDCAGSDGYNFPHQTLSLSWVQCLGTCSVLGVAILLSENLTLWARKNINLSITWSIQDWRVPVCETDAVWTALILSAQTKMPSLANQIIRS